MYSNPQSRVILNEYQTEYFPCPIGVKQGDCLSPTLFAIFINDLANKIKDTNLGIKLELGNNINELTILNILLYADDIVCLAENEEDLQAILFETEQWCRKWRLEINLTKTNIMHVRNKNKQQSKFMFLFDKQPVPFCSSYKYLGVNINESLNLNFTIDLHCDAAGRALSAVVAKMIKNGGLPFNVYSMLYSSCVTSVSDYSASITGFCESSTMLKLHLRAIRAFLGVPKNAPGAGVLSEVGLLLPKFRTRLEMIRHYHRMINMPDNRISKKVFHWDKKLNLTTDIRTWYSEVGQIFEECNQNMLFSSGQNFDIKTIIKSMTEKFFQLQSQQLSEECSQLPKLRTFILFKDFHQEPSYIYKPLSFFHRRFLAKIRLGCLPLRIETGRYSIPRLPEGDRLCLVCDKAGNPHPSIESEIHFLFDCNAYHDERIKWLEALSISSNLELLSVEEKLRLCLNECNNLKQTAIYINKALDKRNRLLQ